MYPHSSTLHANRWAADVIKCSIWYWNHRSSRNWIMIEVTEVIVASVTIDTNGIIILSDSLISLVLLLLLCIATLHCYVLKQMTQRRSNNALHPFFQSERPILLCITHTLFCELTLSVIKLSNWRSTHTLTPFCIASATFAFWAAFFSFSVGRSENGVKKKMVRGRNQYYYRMRPA